MNYSNYYHDEKNFKNSHSFNIDNASKILKFEIPHINKNMGINNDLFNKNSTQKLLEKLKKIKENYDMIRKSSGSELDIFIKKINKSKETSKKENDFDEKLIASMIYANEEIYQQTPRVIQIICLLFYLEGYTKNYNLILEVLTGEGKTLTISFLALYLSLKGNNVDIITSSPVLAERDANDRKKFYNCFGIKCDYCRLQSKNNIFYNPCDDEIKNECYVAKIVYGDGTNLIGDILRSDFLGKKGRGNRSFDYIIIDEIDNICIDNLRNVVELIDNFPGYKYLEYLYLFIYKALKNEVDKFKKKYIKDFEKELQKKWELIVHNISKETRKFLYFNKKLKFDDEKRILIPENSYEFIDSRIEHWCKMAFAAMFNFKKNKNYYISEDENIKFSTIKPIDFENTGVILKNSVWSGLHQFLQIKEGLTFTEENINSSFMSYLSFFKKYKRIYGITGTLGSKKTQQAMNIIYKINLLKMPPFKTRALKIYEPRVYSDDKLYNNKLINEIIEFSAHHKRIVLVIYEYMSQVIEMDELLKKNKNKLKLQDTEIISYYRSDIENKFLEKQMKPNTIILSTNLSGRGTDIKINNEVKKNGGLHVIITFMPYNERTENQAQGRAGRCGDKGSSITMISAKSNYETLNKRRAEIELEEFKFLINLYAPQLDLNQKFFDEFCQTLEKIKNQNKDISKNIITDLKERWSIFMLKNNINCFMNDKINVNGSKLVYRLYEKITTKNFNDLMKEIKEVKLEDYKFYNSFNQMKSNLPDQFYQNAIETNPGFCLGAYYNQAYSYIVEKKKNYQEKVLNNLKNMKTLCHKFIFQYKEYINIFKEIHKDDEKNAYSNNFLKQFINKYKVMEAFLNNIEKNLNQIEKFEKIIENNYENYIRLLDIKITKKNPIKGSDIKVPKNVIYYFKDFGIEFFFEIECIFNSCIIF